jgi:hypothetical protein
MRLSLSDLASGLMRAVRSNSAKPCRALKTSSVAALISLWNWTSMRLQVPPGPRVAARWCRPYLSKAGGLDEHRLIQRRIAGSEYELRVE